MGKAGSSILNKHGLVDLGGINKHSPTSANAPGSGAPPGTNSQAGAATFNEIKN